MQSPVVCSCWRRTLSDNWAADADTTDRGIITCDFCTRKKAKQQQRQNPTFNQMRNAVRDNPKRFKHRIHQSVRHPLRPTPTASYVIHYPPSRPKLSPRVINHPPPRPKITARSDLVKKKSISPGCEQWSPCTEWNGQSKPSVQDKRVPPLWFVIECIDRYSLNIEKPPILPNSNTLPTNDLENFRVRSKDSLALKSLSLSETIVKYKPRMIPEMFREPVDHQLPYRPIRYKHRLATLLPPTLRVNGRLRPWY